MLRSVGWLLVASCVSVAPANLLAEVPPGYRPLFNGKDLAGWEGNRDIWRAEDGMIVGQSPGIAKNDFLATARTFQDFHLRLQFRLVGGKGNSGIQFRSDRIPNHHEMIGYQADVGENYWGCLYDESRRRQVLVRPPEQLEKVLRKDGWNDYAIRCMGPRIEMFLNGLRVVDYTEPQPDIPQSGLIALQVHSSPHPLRVEFKEIMIQELPTARTAAPGATGFLLRTHREASGAERRYSVYLPSQYHSDPARRWPMIVFLHGSGERGDDGQRSIKVGIGPAIANRGETFPFVVLLPQARQTWLAASPDGQSVIELVDEMLREHRIDPQQVHLTGLSMGGSGSWSIAARHPDRWASMSVLCGRGQLESAPVLTRLPIWAFCGDADRKETVENMRQMVEALRKANGRVQYTEYPGVGHNCWDQAYSQESLYAWMLGHRRSEK